MTQEIERRITPQLVNFRASPDGASGPGFLDGYGAVFNSTSRDLGGWYEEIDPRAFGEPIDDAGSVNLTLHTRVICRAEHDSRLLLGTTDAGTLRLFVDETGLRYEDELPDTNAGRDVAALAKRKDYRYSSFAFYVLPGGAEWREDAEGRLVRRVTNARLVDVAPVADPAYWGATTGMRSFQTEDLDAIRASLKPSDAAPAVPAMRARAAVAARAFDITNRIERGV